MSYEKKIREMMDRLAAMSPEPPPYPEEMTTARPGRQRSRRPALAFATAAALVAILAIPLLLFTGGEAPMGADSTTTTVTAPSTTLATTSTTVPETTSTTDGATDTTQAVLPVWSQPVYLYQMPTDSFGNNPAMVPVWVEVSPLDPDAAFTDALAAIGSDVGDSLHNAVPADVSIVSTRLEDDLWTVDVNAAFLDGAGGLLADMTMLNQLIYTITLPDSGTSVLFTVGGAPVEAFGSEGLVLTEPVDRESFREDHLHRINLTRPIVEHDGQYLIEGVANVFEATVAIAVVDEFGDIIDDQFVDATCGSGCWGDFSAAVESALVVPGESSIRVFQYSAEDGSVVDAITVPIPPDGVWRFTIAG
jgi:germination protein M